MDFEQPFCPVCDRQILPKRTEVDVVVDADNSFPAALPPPPPPSSPNQAQRRKQQQQQQHARGGLVHGTGRVKPNGSLKPASAPKKSHRVVIDQGPYPLYCSEECRLVDLKELSGAYPHDFNPNRDYAPSSRHSSPIDAPLCSDEEYESASSSQSSASSSSDSYDIEHAPTVAEITAMYPPPPPVRPTKREKPKKTTEASSEYNSGIMGAHKFLQSTYSYGGPSSTANKGKYSNPPERRVIPGWNDGSHAWRAALYSFAPVPTTATSAADVFGHLENSSNSSLPCKAYDGFEASPHRAALNRREQEASSSAPPALAPPLKKRSESDELLEKFSQSFTKRSESRSSLAPMVSPCSSSERSPPKRDRSIIPSDAEAKLLVPKVMTRSNSSQSLSSASIRSFPSSTTTSSSYPRTARSGLSSSRPLVRSPLSFDSLPEEENADGDVTLRGDVLSAGLPKPKRPIVETRSWSYDNMPTYPIMNLPGQSSKKLFLFPGKAA